MRALDSKSRSQLDEVCQKAHEKAEEAAHSALQKRAVDAAEPHAHFTPAEKELWNRLRARGCQVGDVRQPNKTQSIDQLTQELAYEYWHRMLFARFLAENHLLMHPDGVAVSLEECEEMAKSEGAANGFVLAARYASKMLPQVFRTDDVLLEVEFAPEQRLALEKLLAGLPRETFLADDSLGWVYQFWQSKRKDEVNKSGDKIDGRTLPAVTQLFTEDYMVQFLLHNTIGAWWCSRHGIKGPAGGAGVPAGKAPVEMPYLRWRDDGTPAAGTFDGWPKKLQEFTMLDPCCGSGHFLVAAFNLLVPLRMHDDGLTAIEACNAVLRKNLFGLELDPRCTQIAAFALAVAAWKFAGDDGQPLGYRELPPLNIACTGIGPQATEDEWLKLAEQAHKPMSVLSREPILNGLRNLHALFSDAPTLGSLIDPNQLSADLISADFETLQPYLVAALTAEHADDDAYERAVAAAGMVKAAELLAGEYTLAITNVPYLGRGDQCELLQYWSAGYSPTGKGDIATTFIERVLHLGGGSHTIGVVSPHEWWFLRTSATFRKHLLTETTWRLAATLGEEAWQSFGIRGPKATLLILDACLPGSSHSFGIIDALPLPTIGEKCEALRCGAISWSTQKQQELNPDHRITVDGFVAGELLSESAAGLQGVSTADMPRFVQRDWEQRGSLDRWKRLQGSISETCHYGGRESIIDFDRLADEATELGAAIRGRSGWCKNGVAVRQLRSLYATLYTGEVFDTNVAVIVPKDAKLLGSLWAYCSSPQFTEAIRRIDKKKNVTNGTMVKVPFDPTHWQQVAADEYPNGLPEPESDDPTQWLFHGRPEASIAPLQVAVARLLDYRWLPELDAKMRLSQRSRELVQRCDELLRFADDDGIVCIPALRDESPAAERLLEILHAAYGPQWSHSLLHDLLTGTGCKPGTTLDDWLYNAFFEQHCKLFQNRPFIWQIWDGRKDGFSCLLNYHKLNYKTLDNLTHSYLEGWIKKQVGDAKTGKAGADLRIASAQALQGKLKLILAGEPPYDIFVRWKPLHEQAIGWQPDLNDGVRMNIRPFIEAGILRKNPNIKWTKDRGKEPERDKKDFPWFWNGKEPVGDRINDIHLTNAEKQAAVDCCR